MTSRWLTGFGVGMALAVGLACDSMAAMAATAPDLGRATPFAILAGSTVTNTGPTTITGDLGLHPGTAVTGFPPGTVNGTMHVADTVAMDAKTDLQKAYDSAAANPCTSTLTGDLGGQTLVPGVYCFTSSAQLTGTLTLDGKGDPNAVFIFKIAQALTTASNSRVSIINGGACGVYWQVGSSATLGTDSTFLGTLLVQTSITLNTRANILPGRALAQTGAVTLDSNQVTRPPDSCTTASSSTSTTLTSSPNPTSGTVTFTATVTSPGGTPTGTVTFKEGTTILGTAPVDSSGRATLTISGLPPGDHVIIAVYSGGPGFLPSASPPLTQTVIPGPSPNPAPTPTPAPTLPRTGTPVAARSLGPAPLAGLLLLGPAVLVWRLRRRAPGGTT